MKWLLWRCYSAFLLLAQFAIKFVANFKPEWQSSLENRSLAQDQVKRIQKMRQTHNSCAVFYVSSAGEYEQAKPLIKLLKRDLDSFILIVCFSESGYRYAKSQGESEVLLKAPWDFHAAWTRLFKALNPDFTIVVRHELWPAFCSVAARYSHQLVLINAQSSRTVETNWIAAWIQRLLLSKFKRLYLINEQDLSYFSERLGIQSEKLSVVGDTKYDRVFERISERQDKFEEVQQQIDLVWPPEEKKRLIIGSAWPADVGLVLEALKHHPSAKKWQVIIAPHDVGTQMVASMEADCSAAGFESVLYTELDKKADSRGASILIVNTIGVLAELYGIADIAFVGGALHHRVHNVLEPSCRGLPVAFGPRYYTSQEAVWLVNRKLVAVCESSEQLLSWWLEKERHENLRDLDLLKGVQSLCGASESIQLSLRGLEKGL